MVDVSIISAPPSTSNNYRARGPERHPTTKGNPWFFGLKTHIGVDSRTKSFTRGRRARRLHGEETQVWGDSAYPGHGPLIRDCAPNAQDNDPPALSAQRRD